MALIEHLEKLRYFVKLAQFKSISEAAEAMRISQAGLSKSLASLESVLDVQLFLRSAQGLFLTKEGEITLLAARKILADATSLELSLRTLQKATIPAKLKIGMYDSIAVYFFEDLFTYLRNIYEDLGIELVVDSSARLARAVEAGAIDLCIGVNLHSNSVANCEFFLLFEDHYAFYVAAKKEVMEASESLIFHPTATDHAGLSVEEHLKKLIERRGAHRVYNFETIKTLTVQGIGVGVLPTQVAKPLLAQRNLQQVSLPRFKSTFGRHTIGFLAAREFLARHPEFASDIYRLGSHWVNV